MSIPLNPPLIWFIVGLILFFLELAMPGLVIIFFGIGAWIVAVACFLTAISVNTQLILFLVSSVIVLISLRNRFKVLFSGYSRQAQNPVQNIDDISGQKAVVQEPIQRNKPGKVEFHGTSWTAESDEEIAAGATVEITGKENLTLKVKKL